MTVLSDGRVMEENLTAVGKDLPWLRQQLNAQNITQSDVFLMTATQDGTTYLVKKQEAST